MADGLHAGDTVGKDVLIDKTSKNYKTLMSVNEISNACSEDVVFNNNLKRASANNKKLFRNLCAKNGTNVPQEDEEEEDCRKKRCVDRYDSSESSDSGVAVLSCTDCSGSSTASSDITEPGSPFSTASNNSEDSGAAVQLPKMPPAQSAHHPPWPWTVVAEEAAGVIKRPLNDKTAFTKRPKTNNNNNNEESSPSLAKKNKVQIDSSPTNNNNYKVKMQQGKITEYFKTQVKSNGMRRLQHQDLFKIKANNTVIGNVTSKNGWRVNAAAKKIEFAKTRKTCTIPRKILPAPSKMQEPIPATAIHPFTPTMTLTAVSFPPNLTYLHTKTPKPPDNIFMPQIINRNPCMIQPVQNFVKLNATVVPIVNLNALPQRLSGIGNNNVTLSVDTAVPTVLPVRPKGTSDNLGKTSFNNGVTNEKLVRNISTEEPYRTEECQMRQLEPQEPPDAQCWTAGTQSRIPDQKSPSPTDSDSGISSRGSLEISVDEQIKDEPKKSPILSQPKTIRFPPVQRQNKEKDDGRDLGKSPPQSNDGRCRWDECVAQFDTSGALLEHLQVNHVISQSKANQEQYVCLWSGCKVHGRTSCSISWLERHVLAHAGTKPFRCIVDGCGHRFNSQLMLERHVNNHFNSDGTQNTNTKKSVENGPVKLFKRNGRIIRFRRQPWSARMFDFIDPGIMEGLQHKLLRMTQARTLGQISCAGEIINLQSHIVARRTDSKGKMELLVRWHPVDVTPDEWILEKDYKPIKTVSIPKLSPQSREALSPTLFPYSQRRADQKHRRKPLKST